MPSKKPSISIGVMYLRLITASKAVKRMYAVQLESAWQGPGAQIAKAFNNATIPIVLKKPQKVPMSMNLLLYSTCVQYTTPTANARIFAKKKDAKPKVVGFISRYVTKNLILVPFPPNPIVVNPATIHGIQACITATLPIYPASTP